MTCGGEIHDAHELFPVVHLLEGQVLHRSSGNDHTVEMEIPDFVEGLIKTLEVLERRVFGNMLGRAQKRDIDLKGRVAEQPQNLRFRGYLCGHEIDDGTLEGTDVLRTGTVLGHHKDIFFFQCCSGGEI